MVPTCFHFLHNLNVSPIPFAVNLTFMDEKAYIQDKGAFTIQHKTTILDEKQSHEQTDDKEEKMKLIIFGSTGGTGHQIVSQAIELGHEVTAFARSPEKISLTHDNLRIVQGNVLDYPSVKQAIKGHDAVICNLGLSAIMDKSNLRTNGTKNIIRAMERSNIKRFICQSSHGIGDTREALPFSMKYIIVPFMLRRVFADHETQEKIILDSTLDWIIVRPVALIDGEHTKIYQYGYSNENPTVTNKISRADVADFMLKQLSSNTYLHRTPSISY